MAFGRAMPMAFGRAMPMAFGRAMPMNVRTGEGSCFYQCPVTFSAVSSWIGFKKQLTSS